MSASDLFAGTEHAPPRRAKARVMAHVADAGPDAIRFECAVCGWGSGWRPHDLSVSQARRGIPCERCNQGAEGTVQTPRGPVSVGEICCFLKSCRMCRLVAIGSDGRLELQILDSGKRITATAEGIMPNMVQQD